MSILGLIVLNLIGSWPKVHFCRHMPLSAEAGANQVNSQDPEISQEQSLRKPKAFEKGKTGGVAAKKRSLKRL